MCRFRAKPKSLHLSMTIHTLLGRVLGESEVKSNEHLALRNLSEKSLVVGWKSFVERGCFMDNLSERYPWWDEQHKIWVQRISALNQWAKQRFEVKLESSQKDSSVLTGDLDDLLSVVTGKA